MPCPAETEVLGTRYEAMAFVRGEMSKKPIQSAVENEDEIARTEALLASVDKLLEARRRRSRKGLRLAGMMIGLFDVITLTAVFFFREELDKRGDWYGLIYVASPVIGLALIGLSWYVRRNEWAVLEELAYCKDLRAVAPLLTCVSATCPVLFPSRTCRRRYQAFITAVTRLLLRMGASDAALFHTESQKSMYQHLASIPSSDEMQAGLQIAIVRALEQIGDIEAIPYIRRLAKVKPRSVRQASVCEAARAALPFLEQQAAVRGIKKVLLRPSMQTPSVDTLLRPAESSPSTAPEQLLKASKEGE